MLRNEDTIDHETSVLILKGVIKEKVERYFSLKKTQEGYVEDVISFLCSAPIIDLVRDPYLLEESCYLLSDSNSNYPHPSLLWPRHNKTFFHRLLLSVIRRYMKTMNPNQEYNIDCSTDTTILEKSGYEVAFIQYYAFQLFNGATETAAKINTLAYLSQCKPKLDITENKILELPIALMTTGLFDQARTLNLYFKSQILVEQFSAQFLTSCVISGSDIPTQKYNSLTHGWLNYGDTSLSNYLKDLRNHPEKSSILRSIEYNLRALEDEQHCKSFLTLMDRIYVSPKSCKYLAQSIKDIPKGFSFKLVRQHMQIRIFANITEINESTRVRCLTILEDRLKSVLQESAINDVVVVSDDKLTELIIESGNANTLNAVVEILKISGGTNLSIYLTTHPFFLNAQSKDYVDDKKEVSVNCTIS